MKSRFHIFVLLILVSSVSLTLGIQDGYGACCTPDDGECAECAQDLCVETNNIPQGNNTVCTIHTCLKGACCFDNGECGRTKNEICDLAGGQFIGFGIFCENDTCPISDDDGACCCDDDTCIVIDSIVCLEDLGGTFLGVGVNCTENICEPIGDDDDDNGGGDKTVGWVFLGVIATILIAGILLGFTLVPSFTRTTVQFTVTDTVGTSY